MNSTIRFGMLSNPQPCFGATPGLQQDLNGYLSAIEHLDSGLTVSGRSQEFVTAVERQMGISADSAPDHRKNVLSQVGQLRLQGNVRITPDDLPALKEALLQYRAR